MMAYIQNRNERQQKTADWAKAAFGEHDATNLVKRGLRLLEEAVEAAQAVDVPLEQAHALVDYVYNKPKGNICQELGGVGTTVLVMSAALGISADAAEMLEVDRVLSKPLDYFTARNEVKNEAGF